MDDSLKLQKIRELVNLQAEDEILWASVYGKQTIQEVYLQKALRELHLIIECDYIKITNGFIAHYKQSLEKEEQNKEKETKDTCPCGRKILSDTQDWRVPRCVICATKSGCSEHWATDFWKCAHCRKRPYACLCNWPIWESMI